MSASNNGIFTMTPMQHKLATNNVDNITSRSKYQTGKETVAPKWMIKDPGTYILSLS